MNLVQYNFIFQKTAFIVGALCLLVFSSPGNLFSQDSNLIAEIEKAYEAFNTTEAEIKSKTVLKNYRDFTTDELTTVHKILGLIAFSKNDSNLAEEHFRLALSLTPRLTLDPVLISPKIIDFFQSVKKKMQTRAIPGKDETQLKYLLLEDARPAAALRSMILPGWGQFYKKEKRKGKVLMTLWGLSVLSTATAHFRMKSAKDDYLGESNSEKIDSAYNKYNGRYKLRNNLLLVSVGVWLFSYFDAFYKKTNRIEPGKSTGLNLMPLPANNTLAFQLTLKF